MPQNLRLVQTPLHLALAVVLGLLAVDGARLKPAADATHLGYVPGDVIDGFHLEKHLGNIPMKDNPALAINAASTTSSDEDVSASVLLEQWEVAKSKKDAGTNVDSTGRPLVAFPSRLPEELGNPVHLGAGSFGESWLVTGGPGTSYEGRQVVAKFLYIEVSRGRYSHVTKDRISTNPVLRKEVKEAAHECNFAKRLQKAAVNMSSSSARNAQRLMACYGHNFMKKTKKSTPIYLILENCGADDLQKFIKKNPSMDQELMGSIVRQILEGLQYLAEITPTPVIHHDLKPANIVVKKVDGSRIPTVHLIDFGAMMEADPRLARKGTVATSVYAPPEWFSGYAFKAPAAAFDMYAVGNILADMALGATFGEIYWDRGREMPNFKRIGSVATTTSRSGFCDLFSAFATPGLDAMAADSAAYNFIVENWVSMVANSATDRPSPESVLRSEWMTQSPSPNDAGWIMYSPPVAVAETPGETPGVEGGAEGDEEGGADESSGCLPACDLCLQGDGHKKIQGTRIFRPKVVCAVEIENLKDPSWVRSGINSQFCSKNPDRMAVGRNKHGKDGQQEYYTWDCAEMEAEEKKIAAKGNDVKF